MGRLNRLGAKAVSELLHQLYSAHSLSPAEHLCRVFSDNLDYDLFFYDGSGLTFSQAHPACDQPSPTSPPLATLGWAQDAARVAIAAAARVAAGPVSTPTHLGPPYKAVIGGRRGPRRSPTVTFIRFGRDFSNRERAWLRLLEPHLAQLHAGNPGGFAPAATAGGPAGRGIQARDPDPGEIVERLRQLGLTAREAQVLLWVSRGKTNAEIAIILEISDRTVGKHMEHIAGKLGVETRTSAAAIALETLTVRVRQRSEAGRADMLLAKG